MAKRHIMTPARKAALRKAQLASALKRRRTAHRKKYGKQSGKLTRSQSRNRAIRSAKRTRIATAAITYAIVGGMVTEPLWNKPKNYGTFGNGTQSRGTRIGTLPPNITPMRGKPVRWQDRQPRKPVGNPRFPRKTGIPGLIDRRQFKKSVLHDIESL